MTWARRWIAPLVEHSPASVNHIPPSPLSAHTQVDIHPLLHMRFGKWPLQSHGILGQILCLGSDIRQDSAKQTCPTVVVPADEMSGHDNSALP